MSVIQLKKRQDQNNWNTFSKTRINEQYFVKILESSVILQGSRTIFEKPHSSVKPHVIKTRNKQNKPVTSETSVEQASNKRNMQGTGQ